MRIRYYSDTDSLYISFNENLSVNAVEVAPNVVVDFDEAEAVVGIDIYQNASTIVDLNQLEVAVPHS